MEFWALKILFTRSWRLDLILKRQTTSCGLSSSRRHWVVWRRRGTTMLKEEMLEIVKIISMSLSEEWTNFFFFFFFCYGGRKLVEASNFVLVWWDNLKRNFIALISSELFYTWSSSLSLFVSCLEDVDQFLENFVSFVKVFKRCQWGISWN